MGKSHKSDKKSKKKHKHKERKAKKKAKKHNKHKEKADSPKDTTPLAVSERHGETDFAIPLDLMNSKSHAPETPTEYQKRQSRIRREVDPSTGRIRLIKGDGEVLEEIVSKDRHKAINKEATRGDGAYFEDKSLGKSK